MGWGLKCGVAMTTAILAAPPPLHQTCLRHQSAVPLHSQASSQYLNIVKSRHHITCFCLVLFMLRGRGGRYPAQVFAQAYDNPIPGYNTKTVGNLRLFEALAEHEFQLEYFNEGDFAKVRLPGCGAQGLATRS